MNERLLNPVSDAELRRRWAAVREAMADHGIDALIVQSNNDWLGGLAAFRTTVLWHGPRPKPDVPYDLVEMARRSDFLIVACNGSEETRGLISATVIDALGPQGTLINVARGSVVDEKALIERLRDGRLGFAALDVFQNEPRIAPAFFELPNVLLQPHQGSATVETRTAIGQLMIDNLTAHFAGLGLPMPVT